jgi:vitamin B12 transporter
VIPFKLVSLLFIFFHLNLLAATNMDEIVVSSKAEISSDNFTASHVMLDEEEFKNDPQVLDSLRKVPGVFVDQTGGPGSQASIRIRGSEVRHVLVLIDGVKVFDPSNTDRHFNAAYLNLTDVKKIEVLKGAQGHLYGADAIGGVINIITHKGLEKKQQKFTVEAGGTNGLSVALGESLKDGAIYFNGFANESRLISAAANGDELDGVKNQGVNLSWSKALGTRWWSTLGLKYIASEAETDSAAFTDDDTATAEKLQQLYNWQLEYENRLLKFTNQLSINRHDRINNSSYGEYAFYGQNITEEMNLSIESGEDKFVLGLRLDQEQVKSKGIDDEMVNMQGLYLQHFYNGESYFSNIGVRADNHEIFGSVGTAGLGVGKHWSNGWTTKTQLSNGFKSPSLYQLYAPALGAPFNCNVGNLDLAPEKSGSVDFILEKTWNKNKFEATIFYNDIEDYIDYDCNTGYQNASHYYSRGIELVQSFEIDTKHNLQLSVISSKFYRNQNLKVPRRPEFQAEIEYDYGFNDRLSFNVHWRVVGKRFDYINQKLYELHPYQILDFGINYLHGSKEWSLVAKNLFDQSYEEARGYNTLGQTLFGKVTVGF